MAAYRICKIEGCGKDVGRSGAKGMCGMHYMRLKRHNDPDRGLSDEPHAAAMLICQNTTPPAGARFIPLTKGRVAIVDEADYGRIAQHRWQVQTTPKGGVYASRHAGGDRMLMHREVIGAHPDQYVDHENGDGLDNRRSNIRICTQAQNALNHGGYKVRTSRFKGLYRDKRNGRWVAAFRGKYIGIFDDEESAALAYDSVAFSAEPDFAHLNFPERMQCQAS